MRHAEAQSNVLSIESYCPPDHLNGLTRVGQQEAFRFVEVINSQSSRISTVVCAPARRALETAQIVSDQLGANLVVWPQLREIFTVETPTCLVDLHRQTIDFWRTFFQLEPVERSALAPCREASEAIERLVGDFAEEDDVIAISHGGKIELITVSLMAVGRTDRTLQFDLATGRFHLFELTARAGALQHCRMMKLNA